MRCYFRVCVVACAAFAAGCYFLFPRVNYKLTATVGGLVGEADLRPIAGNRYSSTMFSWRDFSTERGHLLLVRLSTSKDLVPLSNRTGTLIDVRWHFCDEPREKVRLGGWEVFLNGVALPALPRGPSPAIADDRGQFGYDAILYPRDGRSAKARWDESEGQYEKTYDLEREPRDVCARVVLAGKLGGYRTNVARIPKEEIAAALGVVVPSAPSNSGKTAQ